MEKKIYHLIEAYARGQCDADCFTGELTALCCRGARLEGISEEEAMLLDTLCAGAQRYADEDAPFPGRDMLDETQFRAFFDRLYPALRDQMPCGIQADF